MTSNGSVRTNHSEIIVEIKYPSIFKIVDVI